MSWISSSKLMPSECFSGCRRKFVQLVLQFDDRLFEIELMFHAFERVTDFRAFDNAKSVHVQRKKRKAGLSSGLSW